tara:strand:+ start:408 stop:2426 length:2019 start_codon:yes stop_codon:yes gene_type:complete
MPRREDIDAYLNEDYTISFYESVRLQRTKKTKQVTTEEVVTTSSQQITVAENFSYTQATGSDRLDNILHANESLNAIFGTASGYYTDTFGDATYVSGNYAAVSVRMNSTSPSANDLYSGVLILKSGSAGWTGQQHLTVTSSLMPLDSAGNQKIDHYAKAFSYDRKNGKHVVISVMTTGGSGAHDLRLRGKVFIFSSSSSGFELVQTLTTASLPDSIKNHFGSTNADSSGQYYTEGYHNWASSCRVDGDHITVGSLVRHEVPKSEWDQPSLLPSSATHASSPGVVVFKSSSSGFVYETFLDGYDIQIDGTTNANYGLDNNLSHDLKDGRCVFAGNGGWLGGGWSSTNGRIRVWNSSSSGWVNEGSLDLYNLGFTGSMSDTIGTENYSLDSTMDNFPSWPTLTRPAYAFYYHFGRKGLAVSGDYIVAAAESRDNDGYFDVKLSNRLFIIKSGSTGWQLEKSFKSPNTAAEGDETVSFDDRFAEGGLAIHNGTVLANAGGSKEDENTHLGNGAGRAYFFKSSSASGWAFDTSISNPFSGSSTHELTQYNYGRMTFASSENGIGYPLNGFYYPNQAPGLGGTETQQHAFIPYIGLDKDLSGNAVRGAVYILKGSGSMVEKTIETEVTESVETTSFIDTTSSNGDFPFRLSNHGPYNLRPQKSGSFSYKTFIGEQNS